jgi:exosortase/archaeosortase family protein
LEEAENYLRSPLLDRDKIDLVMKSAAIALLTLAFFHRDFSYTFENAFQNTDASIVLFILLVFIYLVYRKRRILAATAPIENRDQPKRIRYLLTLIGVLVPTAALMLYWYGSLSSTPLAYHFLALPIFVTGLVLLLFNYQTLGQLLFPALFLVFLTPIPFGFLQGIGEALSAQSLGFSVLITRIFGVPSALSTAGQPAIMIQGSKGTFDQVPVALTPVYYVLNFVVFVGLAAYLTRGKLSRKVTTVFQVIPLIYFLNIIRVTTLVSVNYYLVDGSVFSVFILLGGWISIYAGIIWLSLITKKNSTVRTFKTGNTIPENTSNNKSDFNFLRSFGRIQVSKKEGAYKVDLLKIAAVALSIIVLASIQSPIFAVTPSPSIQLTDTLAGQQVSVDIFPSVSNYSLQVFQSGSDTENFACFYSPVDVTQELIRVSVQLASDRSMLPPWNETMIRNERSLIQQGKNPDTKILEVRSVELYKNPHITGSYLVWWDMKTAQTEVVLYWYESAMFKINSTTEHKYVLLSIRDTPNGAHASSNVENQLTWFAEKIISYWQPVLPWSVFTGIVTTYGDYIAGGFLGGSFVLTAVLFSAENRKRRRAGRIAYLKVSEHNRQFVDAILNIEQKAEPTIDKIADSYQKKSGQNINDNFGKTLAEMMRVGVLKRSIVSKDDDPIYVWRTSFS